MKEPVLQILKKKYTGETSIISTRMPRDMVQDIDKVAERTGRSRNEIILLSMEFALTHMKIEEKQNDES